MIHQGNTLEVLKTLPDESVDCIITSPPYYGLRDYEMDGQIGLENSMTAYLDKMLAVTAELKRVLKPSGTMWWNHGDSYAGSGKGWGDTKPDPKFKSLLRGGGTARSRTIRPERSHIPAKSLMLQAHRLAIRMVDEQGWTLRNQVIWHKPNAMPSSAKDRFTVDFEPVFFFTKTRRYYFNQDAIRVPNQPHKLQESMATAKKLGWDGKGSYADWYHNQREGKDWVNKKESGDNLTYGQAKKFSSTTPPDLVHPAGRTRRATWSIPTKPFKDAHFAVYPTQLIAPMVQAGCPEGGVVLDPFFGSGTTGVAALAAGREYIGIELNPEYIKLAEKRLAQKTLL